MRKVTWALALGLLFCAASQSTWAEICRENGRPGNWASLWMNADIMREEFLASGGKLASVKVAIIDSGYDQKGAGKRMLRAPKSFVKVGSLSTDPRLDQIGHGTGVVSLFLGPEGIGLAPEVALSVFGAGLPQESSQEKGMMLIENMNALTPEVESAVIKACDQGNKIINASFNSAQDEMGRTRMETENKQLLAELAKKGCIVVKAAGNAGNKTWYSTNDLDDSLLRVGSRDRTGSEYKSSSRGELSAPGVKILMLGSETGSAMRGNPQLSYCGIKGALPATGTSFAAPLTSVVLAYVQAVLESSKVFLSLNGPAQVRLKNRILKASEMPSGLDGLRALIHARRWVQAASGEIPSPEDLRKNLQSKPEAICAERVDSATDLSSIKIRRRMSLCAPPIDEVQVMLIWAINKQDFNLANWIAVNANTKGLGGDLVWGQLLSSSSAYPDIEAAYLFFEISERLSWVIPRSATDRFESLFTLKWSMHDDDLAEGLGLAFLAMVEAHGIRPELFRTLMSQQNSPWQNGLLINAIQQKAVEPPEDDLFAQIINVLTSNEDQGYELKSAHLSLLSYFDDFQFRLESLLSRGLIRFPANLGEVVTALTARRPQSRAEQIRSIRDLQFILAHIPKLENRAKLEDWQARNQVRQLYAALWSTMAQPNSALLEFLTFPTEENRLTPLGSPNDFVYLIFGDEWRSRADDYIEIYQEFLARSVSEEQLDLMALTHLGQRAWSVRRFFIPTAKSVEIARSLFVQILHSPSMKNPQTRSRFLAYVFDMQRTGEWSIPAEKILPFLELALKTEDVDPKAKTLARALLGKR